MPRPPKTLDKPWRGRRPVGMSLVKNTFLPRYARDVCYCGHIRNDHDAEQACMVSGCKCELISISGIEEYQPGVQLGTIRSR